MIDSVPVLEELLKNAAKQRVRRMVAPKTKRTDLAVPSWVADRWHSGTTAKEEMAHLLQEVNWDKAGVPACRGAITLHRIM